MKITFIRPNMAEARAADAMQPLSIAVLSGLTPCDVDREFYDECVEEIPTDIETGLAAISAHTFSALRAYRIADAFRRRGIPVVLGGYHPSACPREALGHADSVVVGPAEGVWEKVVADVRAGGLAKIYRSRGPLSLSGVRYDRTIFRGKKYTPLFPVEFGRGCRFRCEFCSVSAFHGHMHAVRALEDVLEDVRAADPRRVLFVDDNIFADRVNAGRLFEALEGAKVQWGCQISIDVAGDASLLERMARSGCRMVLIGFESLLDDNLRQMKKGSHRSAADYRTAIEKLRDQGIMIYGSFVFGYDADSKDVFARTVDFALEHRFALANFNTLNPMPGTRLHQRLRAEGRLLEERWWLDEKYRYGEVMFVPRLLSPQELKEGCIWARREFFRYSSIAKRLLDPRANSSSLGHAGLFLVANLVARRECMAKMRRIR